MLIVGLTGSSGAGKGYVADIFRKKGIPCLDTDRVCHRIYEKGQACRNELADHFGTKILDADGNVNRRVLGKIVYRDSEKYAELNEIAHRHVKTETLKWLDEQEKKGATVTVIDAPQLFESRFDEMCGVTVAVLCDLQTRIDRLRMRDGIDEDAVNDRLSRQKTDDFFRANCTFVLDNSHSNRDNIREQAAALAERLIKKAGR